MIVSHILTTFCEISEFLKRKKTHKTKRQFVQCFGGTIAGCLEPAENRIFMLVIDRQFETNGIVYSSHSLVTCNNLVDIINLVASLFQQVRYSRDITILLQPFFGQPCNILVIS